MGNDPTVAISVAIKTEKQQLMLEYIDPLGHNENNFNLDHIFIGLADRDNDFNKDNAARALECITIGHQEMSSTYHDILTILQRDHCLTLKILRQLLKSTPVGPMPKDKVKTYASLTD